MAPEWINQYVQVMLRLKDNFTRINLSHENSKNCTQKCVGFSTIRKIVLTSKQDWGSVLQIQYIDQYEIGGPCLLKKLKKLDIGESLDVYADTIFQQDHMYCIKVWYQSFAVLDTSVSGQSRLFPQDYYCNNMGVVLLCLIYSCS